MRELKEELFTEKEVELYTKAYEMLEAVSISGAVEDVELERLKEKLAMYDRSLIPSKEEIAFENSDGT